MSDQLRVDLPAPGSVAWLTISAGPAEPPPRTRTGPLGLQIMPLGSGCGAYSFHGGRLRGTRCILSASTVCGAQLQRVGRLAPAAGAEPAVHLFASVECPGSVFESSGTRGHGVLRVLDPIADVDEQFVSNTHLYTLNVPTAATGVERASIVAMHGACYPLTELQLHLLRSAGGMLAVAENEMMTTARLVGVDRYLGALAGLLLRTAAGRPDPPPERAESVRARVDAIIRDQAADPALTPTSIAAQLAISLRQLYRAFGDVESPAARIRRRRLELAAEMLASRPPRSHVEVIAQQCGFVSPEYFSRAFRREFGVSPRAYRSAHTDRAALA